MLFSSLEFIYLFLPIVIVLYYALSFSVPLKNAVLLCASLLFYAWGERWFVYVMIASIAANYIFGLLIDRARIKCRHRFAAIYLAIGVVCNLSLLFAFKYLTFTLDNIKSVFSLSFAVPKIALPIGISFFTFQSMSYIIDVYRGKALVQKNPFYLALYVSLFPQLIAGPIVRYETIAAQIKYRTETLHGFTSGFCRFLVGLFKKVLISNQMGMVADKAFELNGVGELGFTMAWLGALSYALQIYYDFSGYSDMAIGLGKMFGFRFEENFNYPYISASITEFWRRWHISLGTWFRDYVYIPLGGSRVSSKPRLICNLAVVWGLTGIWHGAQWNFLLWGLWFFVFLTAEKLIFAERIKKADKLPFYKKIPGWIYAMSVVLFGWVLFRAENLPLAFSYFASMFSFTDAGGGNSYAVLFITQKSVYYISAVLFACPLVPFIKSRLNSLCTNRRAWIISVMADVLYPVIMVIMFLVTTAFLLKSDYNPFIYFKF